MNFIEIKYLENINISHKDAFIVVDVQNDFIPGGKLPVEEGDKIIPGINKLMRHFYDAGSRVILTQDWHPVGHASFASSHEGKNPFDPISNVEGIGPILWPDHCVQGSVGANFHGDLETNLAHLIIRKGYRSNLDSYSGFIENDKTTTTGLSGYLHSHNTNRVLICGLALDYCVFYSSIDARQLGFEVIIVLDLCRGIAEETMAKALREMQINDIKFIKNETAIK